MIRQSAGSPGQYSLWDRNIYDLNEEPHYLTLRLVYPVMDKLLSLNLQSILSVQRRLRLWMYESDSRRIFGSALTVGFLTVSFKVASLFKELLVAATFGTSDSLDSYLVALLLPSMAVNILAGSLNAALIPAFISIRDREGNGAAQRLFSGVTALSVGLLSLLTVLLGLALPYILPILAWGFPPEKLALTRSLTLIMLPVIVLSGLATLWGSILNANERFALVAFSPVTIPLLSMVALVFGRSLWGIYAFSLGFVLGTLLQLFVLGWGLKRLGYLLFPLWYGTTPALWQVLAQYLPMIGAAAIMNMSSVVDQSMASTLGAGSVSILNYGNKVVFLILGVTSTAIGTAVLPYFSKIIASGDWTKLGHILKQQTVLIVAMTLPLTTGIVLYSEPIVRLLFQRGTFTSADTFAVGGVQAMYALQIPVYTLGIVFVRLISALAMNKVLMYGTMISFMLNIMLDVMLMRHMGVKGIALATSFVYLASFVYFYCCSAIAVQRRAGRCG